MIRQAINCDICAAEKQTSNYWFVAYEQAGELKVRGWESPQNSRKGAKHLCGQKCAQRMMANFMASLMASVHSSEQDAEPTLEGVDLAVKSEEVELVNRSERSERIERVERKDRLDRTDRSLVGRGIIDSADLEAESWVGPVRIKDESWEAQGKRPTER